jgi:CBS domain containing-hemolysin-like protein
VTNAPAVHAAIRAVRRNRLAKRASAAYSSFHRSTPINERKDRTMKATSTQMRLTSLLLAVLASVTVLGATVAGMQPGAAGSHAVVVMEDVTVKPTAVQ